jgi:hypothetical protein
LNLFFICVTREIEKAVCSAAPNKAASTNKIPNGSPNESMKYLYGFWESFLNIKVS